ncbi:MAG: hypothetical protein ACX94B_13165 [Henriciella sp.]
MTQTTNPTLEAVARAKKEAKSHAWRCALSAMDHRLDLGDTAYDALRAAVKAFADEYSQAALSVVEGEMRAQKLLKRIGRELLNSHYITAELVYEIHSVLGWQDGIPTQQKEGE